MLNESNITRSGNLFIGNRALNFGGAVFAINSSLLLKETLGNDFLQNSASRGEGAVSCMNSTIEIAGDKATEAINTELYANEEATNADEYGHMDISRKKMTLELQMDS